VEDGYVLRLKSLEPRKSRRIHRTPLRLEVLPRVKKGYELRANAPRMTRSRSIPHGIWEGEVVVGVVVVVCVDVPPVGDGEGVGVGLGLTEGHD